MRIYNYMDLENEIKKYERIAIFGAGEYGRNWAYDILSCASGDKGIYCYYDNRVAPGTIINGKVEVHDIQELYTHHEGMLLFLAVGLKIQKQLLEQMHDHSIVNVVLVDEIFLTDICSSMEKADSSVVSKYHCVMNNEEFFKKVYRENIGSELDLSDPQTFNEKINWLKLHDYNPLYTELVDKYSVKKYVADIIGEQYVIPTLGIYKHWDDIDFDRLPEQFVMKCTHDSGSTYVVMDKNMRNQESRREWFEQKLSINPYYLCREWPYKNVAPRIIIEQKLPQKDGEAINDYKFFCYNGKVKYLYVATNREKGHHKMRFDFFDCDFNHIPVEHTLYPNADITPQKPELFQEMVSLVTKLAEGLIFVRIDMYCTDDNVYFGEYTFYPGGGREGYPDMLGDDIEINLLFNGGRFN